MSEDPWEPVKTFVWGVGMVAAMLATWLLPLAIIAGFVVFFLRACD